MRRLIQLHLGLCLFGFALALMVRATLGLDPWNVFQQGLVGLTGLTLGQVSIVIGIVVMLAWIPLRQKPGYGTIANIFIIGLVVDASLAALPEFEGLALRIVLMVAGVVLNAVGSAAYIGAGMGPGPRDGLMTGLHERLGWSIRVSRLSIEATVLVAGWLLGGVVGVGTVLYAVAMGPLVQFFLPMFTLSPPLKVSPAPSSS
ncbi:YczE/YyaS/YitT family protein [Brevundimonas sp. LjRoot202]|uniref:membrane protein YczE n=1 Tax=Brevundimonas sp. LjRoot202 TaxID=3342281 RepID=UPI003ECFF425